MGTASDQHHCLGSDFLLLYFPHIPLSLADKEDQEERGMQPPGRGLEPGHLPVQVSLSGSPMSDWTQKPSRGHEARARASNLSAWKDSRIECQQANNAPSVSDTPGPNNP
ncbi:hypothetical protein EYF80_000722 [Liparis tanakae]|uniref:Uncharacterized protein n=1 Tax=Liparis tanakae TaxID=230148 RepID=A0A4Z2JGC1_9TELE|nr:hypothetical protein EYF80_000722 [Liparis tanakae]